MLQLIPTYFCERNCKHYLHRILIVRAFWLVYKCVFIALWSTKMMVGSVSKLWEVTVTVSWKKNYVHALYNFIKEIKHVLLPLQPGENLGKVCENSRAGENLRLRCGFSLICSQILPNIRLGLHQAVKARKTCFISWIKDIFLKPEYAFDIKINTQREFQLLHFVKKKIKTKRIIKELIYFWTQAKEA